MKSSQSGLSLPHIVATSRVDVQRGVAHAAMWRKTRYPCTMQGYDYCGLQPFHTRTRRLCWRQRMCISSSKSIAQFISIC